MPIAADMVKSLADDRWRSFGSAKLHELSDRLYELAAEESTGATQRAFQVLGGVASLHLREDSWEAPYTPWLMSRGRRSFSADDLEPEDVLFLSLASPLIPYRRLRARAADLAWLLSAPSSDRWKFGAAAARTWTRARPSERTWREGGEEEWERSLDLAQRLRLDDLGLAISAKLRDATLSTKVPYFAAQLASLLRTRGSVENADAMIVHLRGLAESAEAYLQRELLLEVANWARRSSDTASEFEAREAIVQSWIKQAEERAPDSRLIEHDFLENALQEARRIPRKSRSATIAELIERLPGRIREAGAAGLEEMVPIELDPIDLSEAVTAVQKQVMREDFLDALGAWFASIDLVSPDAERKSAEEIMAGSISSLFNTGTYAGDGRKIHSTTGGKRKTWGIPDDTWHTMIRHYEMRVGLLVQGHIWPGYTVITAMHRPSQANFRTFTRSSPFVPASNADLFAHGLWRGYYGDFQSAGHILIPQFEAAVRYVLVHAGRQTSTLKDGRETENGLSSLMADSRIEDLFGPELTYEIRALLCGPTGPNLRNNLAHGLMANGGDVSFFIYLWWFALRLAFVPYFNAIKNTEASAGASA